MKRLLESWFGISAHGARVFLNVGLRALPALGIGLFVGLIVLMVATESFARGGNGRGGAAGGGQGMRGRSGFCQRGYSGQYGYSNQTAAMQQRTMQYRYGLNQQNYGGRSGTMYQGRLRDGSGQGQGQSARMGRRGGTQRGRGGQGGGMNAGRQQGGAGVQQRLRDGSCGIPVAVSQPESPF